MQTFVFSGLCRNFEGYHRTRMEFLVFLGVVVAVYGVLLFFDNFFKVLKL